MEMSRRSRQVAGAIQVELADLLRREIHDPRLLAVGWVTVSDVQIAADHRNANVYVSFMGQEEKSGKVQDALKALQHSAKFLHHALVKRLSLKSVPQLYFRYDRSFDEADKVLRAMNEAKESDLALAASAPVITASAAE